MSRSWYEHPYLWTEISLDFESNYEGLEFFFIFWVIIWFSFLSEASLFLNASCWKSPIPFFIVFTICFASCLDIGSLYVCALFGWKALVGVLEDCKLLFLVLRGDIWICWVTGAFLKGETGHVVVVLIGDLIGETGRISANCNRLWVTLRMDLLLK